MKKIWNQITSLVSFIWFPFLLLSLFMFLAYRITGYQDPETVKVTLGVMLGVALGFIADILKRSLDDYKKKENLKGTALALLKDDAEKVYRSMEMMKEARDHKDSAPVEVRGIIESGLPPQLELRYWKRLNQENDFILLGSSEPFKSIFSSLWEIEKINELISSASKNDKQAYMFAMAIYKTALEQRHHEKLLGKFMSSRELQEFKENWRKIKE